LGRSAFWGKALFQIELALIPQTGQCHPALVIQYGAVFPIVFFNKSSDPVWTGAFTLAYPVFIAQHATATCCRGCILKWHGFEKGRALNEAEVDFVLALIMGWIEQQFDDKWDSAV
jgi:hypothetical protein